MTAYEQRSYAGAAADTVLAADLTSVALTISVAAGTGVGYPDGSSGPFFLAVDYDNTAIEKIRCTSRTGDVFTIPASGGRGQDGTTAQAHTAPAKVRHVFTATEAQEANRAAAATVGKVAAKGDLLAGTGVNALDKVTVGADGLVLSADSTKAQGLAWIPLPSTAAWTSYTPVITGSVSNPTFTAGFVNGRYKVTGKTLTFAINVNAAPTSAGSGFYQFHLPVGYTAYSGAGNVIQSCAGSASSSTVTANGGECKIAGGATYVTLTVGGTDIGSGSGTLNFVYISGTIEID